MKDQFSNIKFRKYFAAGPDGERVSCWYSTGCDGSRGRFVEVLANSYAGRLRFLPNLENNTDTQTDYFEKDRARIYERETPELYAAALVAAEQNGRIEAVDMRIETNGKQENQLVSDSASTETLPENVGPFADPRDDNQLKAKKPIGFDTPVQVFRGRVVVEALFAGYATSELESDNPLCFVNDGESVFTALRSNVFTPDERDRLLKEIAYTRDILAFQYTRYSEGK